VLHAFSGVAVHDGWAAYRSFEDVLHALCGAHHLRELTGAEEQGQPRALGMSCLSTARKQGQRPIDVLAVLAAGQPWLPAAPPG
jgi:hypothetical protein